MINCFIRVPLGIVVSVYDLCFFPLDCFVSLDLQLRAMPWHAM